jgi:hypothetical protein
VLSDADREAARKQAFDRIDSDKNGAISFAEFEARRDDRGEARGGPSSPAAAPSLRRSRHAWRPGNGPQPTPTRTATVTQAEFTTAALARFDRADADKTNDQP